MREAESDESEMTQDAFQVRPYRPEDREAVIQLLEQVLCYDQPHNHAAVSVDRKAAYQPELFLTASDGESVIGIVMGGYDGHRGWIYSLAVAEASRRKGVGTRLLRAIEHELRSLGCPKINLQVLPENQEVIAFYQTLGYNVEQRISLGKRVIC